MKRKVLWILFFMLVLVGAAVAFWVWNRPPQRVEAATGETISMSLLCAAYSADESAANKRFLNRAVNITGKVDEIIHNMDGGLMIVMVDTLSTDQVQCAFREKDISLKEGSIIMVKGFCAGKSITGVSLTDCILIP